MAKKRRLPDGTRASGPLKKLSRHPSRSGLQNPQLKTPIRTQSSNKKHRQVHHDVPTIPFKPHDRILLIGEGDLSFAASIAQHHHCVNVTATVFDKDHAELSAKYPTADENIAIFNGHLEAKLRTKSQKNKIEKDSPRTPFERGSGASLSGSESDDSHTGRPEAITPQGTEDGSDNLDQELQSMPKTNNHILYNVDATKLPSFVTRLPPFHHILFNFPHVGGKSTDVNRQVRYNQELLVSFFKRALLVLAPQGTIVVTLFEGEPYTLWNVRDLARHSGLQVERSFRFQANAYPGYRHARTFGTVKNKRGEVAGEGAWKGEERPARSYVFMRKGDVPSEQEQSKKKRRRGDDDSSTEED